MLLNVGCLFQYETVKRVLRLVGKAGLVEQAGKMTVESCLVVITLSLAMVSDVAFWIKSAVYVHSR